MQNRDTYRRFLEESIGGKASALGELLQYHHRDLKAYVERHLPTELRQFIDPQDIIQDVHFEAFRRIGTFIPQQEDSFPRWLLTIARHRMLDALRSHQALKRGQGRQVYNQRPLSPQEDSTVALLTDMRVYDRTPSKSALSRELVALLKQSLTQLPGEYREALLLRYLDDLPVATVAQRMAKSEGAIHMLCHRGLHLLHDKIARLLHEVGPAHARSNI